MSRIKDYLYDTFIGTIWNNHKIRVLCRQWKKNNPQNDTYPVSRFDIARVSVGKYSYGPLDVLLSGESGKLIIGNYVSIAPNVSFLVSAEHPLHNISTFPFQEQILHEKKVANTKGDTIIDDDVWIGYGVTILSGVHVGQGAVIAAGAIVTKDVEPYAVVGGNPAKFIKYRFEKEIREELCKYDFSQLCKNDIERNIELLNSEIKDKEDLKKMEFFHVR